MKKLGRLPPTALGAFEATFGDIQLGLAEIRIKQTQ
jgi:hypothetical protein